MMQATVEQLSLFHPGSRFGEPGEGGPGRRIDPCPRFPPSAPLKGADRGIENRGSGTVDTGTRSGEGGKRGKAELFEQRRKLQDDLAEATIALDDAIMVAEQPRDAYLAAKARLQQVTQQETILPYNRLLPFYEDWRLTSYRLYPLAKRETETRGWRNAILAELKAVNYAIERHYGAGR